MRRPPKIRQKVYDRWWGWWGHGVVIKALKTRWHIRFPQRGDLRERVLVYDRAHLQFLEPAK